MHDPLTVVATIRVPLFWRERWRRPTIAIIWHRDPETDGTDNSCGFGYVKLNANQIDRLMFIAWEEANRPWYQRDPVKRISSPADAEALLRGAILRVAGILRIKITMDEVLRRAAEMAHGPGETFQSSLCFLPGYHTNGRIDTPEDRKECAFRFFAAIARTLLTSRRRWYQHPRWHIHHWELQVPAVLNFKRWMFSRCNICGGAFKYGEMPASNNWNSKGPQWFKSEPDVHHVCCQKRTGDERWNGEASHRPSHDLSDSQPAN